MVWAVILAAGESRRMGSPKLLLPFAGATVLETVVRKVEGAGIRKTLVVLGAEPEKIRASLRGHRLKFVRNADFQTGMLSSVQCGLGALPRSAAAAVVFLADQPQVSEAAIRLVVEAGRAGTHGIVVPVFQGRRGHPLFLNLRYREEIRLLDPAVGLRQLLSRHPDDVLEVAVADDSSLGDIDTPDDYERARAAGGQKKP